MFLENWVVLAKRKLVGAVHRILFGVILTNAGFLRNEADEFALSIALFCHIGKYTITYYFMLYFCKCCRDSSVGRAHPW